MTERTKAGPSIDPVTGRILTCSASQAKSHRLCAKKWRYEKVEKIPKGPPSKGAKESAESHERMEIYLKTGGDARNGYERHGDVMLKPFEWAFPWKGGPMQVEGALTEPEMRTAGGVLITGFFDAHLPAMSNADCFNEAPVIIDHKFLKSLEWAATYDDLAHDDPQATMYMAWALEKQPWVDSVRFRHHNHQKQGPRLNQVVEITQTRERVFERMAALGKYVDTEMQATALAPSVKEVKGNQSACKAFGGCEYRSFCPEAPQNRFLSAMSSGELPDLAEMNVRGSGKITAQPTGSYNFMGLLDDIAKETAPAKPNGQPAAPLLKKMLAEAATKGGIYMLPSGAPAKCKGEMDGKVVFITHTKEMVELGVDEIVRDLEGDATAAALFAPPAAKPPEPEKVRKLNILTKAPEAVKEAVTVDDTPKIDPKAGVMPPDAPQDTNPPKVEVTEAVKVADVVESKKPRAKKSEQVVDIYQTPKEAPQGAGIVLIINAASTHGTPLAPYIAKLAADLCKAHNLVDLRLAPKQSDAAFLGWRGLLAISARINPPAPGFYTVTTGDLADPVIEALEPMAMAVIKGGGR